MNLFLQLYSSGMGLESGWRKQDEKDKVQEGQFSSLGTYYILHTECPTKYDFLKDGLEIFDSKNFIDLLAFHNLCRSHERQNKSCNLQVWGYALFVAQTAYISLFKDFQLLLCLELSPLS